MIKRFPRSKLAAFQRSTELRTAFDDNGLTIERHATGEVVARLAWSEVRRVIAFKRDLLTTDCVCVTFELPGQALEIDEEMPGWQRVVDNLERFFPGARPYAEWWPHVVRSPLDARETLIFERAAEESV